MRRITLLIIFLFFTKMVMASYILIPMDAEQQKSHLKAYGMTYWILDKGLEAYWLLNYDGGSFAFEHTTVAEAECKIRNVDYKVNL